MLSNRKGEEANIVFEDKYLRQTVVEIFSGKTMDDFCCQIAREDVYLFSVFSVQEYRTRMNSIVQFIQQNIHHAHHNK